MICLKFSYLHKCFTGIKIILIIFDIVMLCIKIDVYNDKIGKNHIINQNNSYSIVC